MSTTTNDPLNSPLILMADDDQPTRFLLRRMLLAEGYRVAEAGDGLETLEKYALLRPAVVLLDIMMPELNGFDVCAQLRAAICDDGSQPPVIMITALDDQASVDRAFAAGAADYIAKPIHWPVLRHRIRQLILTTQATQQLRAERNLLRTLIDNLPDYVFVKDAQGRFLTSNSAHSRAVQASTADDLVGKTAFDVFPPDLAEQYETDDQSVLRSGQALLNAERVSTNAAGQRIAMLTTKAPLRNELGQVIGLIGISHDITEQKRAEVTLRESEANFRHLFANNPLPMWVYDLETLAFLDVNEAAVAHYGYSREAFLGMRITDIRPADDVPALLAHVGQMRPDLQASREWRHRLKNGRLIDVAIISHVLEFSGRSAALVVAQDITERKQVETALNQERALLRTLIDNLPDNIFVKDTRGRIIIDNVAHSALLGLAKPEEAVGKTDFDFFTRAMAAMYFADEQAVIQSGQPLLNREEPTVDPAGHTRWLLTTKVPLRNSQGEITGIVGINHDITEQKRAAQVLEESEERFRILFDHSPDGIFLTDRNSLRIVDCNQAACQMNGYRKEELVGQLMSLVDSGLVDETSLEEALASRGQTRQQILEAIHRRKDGSTFPLELSMTIISIAGRELILEIDRDITARKQAETVEREQRLFSEALNNAAGAITSTLDSDLVMTRILDNAGRVLPHETANIMLVEGAMVHAAYWHGYAADSFISAFRSPLEELPTLRHMATTGQPCLIADTSKDATWVDLLQEVASYIGAPIQIHGQVIGFLNLNSSTVGFFTPIHLERLQSFAHLAAISLQNAQLYEGLRLHATSLEERVEARTVELRRMKEQVESILNHSSDGIVVSQVDGTIQVANPAFERMVGFDGGSQPTCSLTAIAQADYVDRLRDALRSVVDSERPARLEILARHADGAAFHADIALSPLRGYDRWQVIGSVRDISEHKRVEAALAHERDLLQALMDNIPDSIYFKDRESRFTRINQAQARFLGIASPDEALGKTDLDFLPALAEWYAAEERQLFTTGQPILDRVEFKPEEQCQWFAATKVPIRDPQGDIVGLVGITRDVTEYKRLEGDLRQALEEQKELNELKSRFVSMASHEFRTPLATINATLENLTAYRAKMTDEAINGRFEKMKLQIRRLTGLMDDVLTIERMRSGNTSFSPVEADLDGFCREIVDEFQTSFDPDRRIQYTCDRPPVLIWMDKKLMRYIVNNLLSNALKYSPQAGPVYLGLTHTDEEAALTVRDTGIGIPEADLKHLFETFHRATNVGTISGTGLGLSIVKQSVEAHRGAIRVDSNVGQGATFTVTLPIRARNGAYAAPTPVEGA